MKKLSIALIAISMIFPAVAHADVLSSGGTVNYTVPGTTSIYQIFGHAGNPGGDYGPATDAVATTFAASAGNVFTFTASGLINCCSNTPDTPPDGGPSSMSIVGANGLSGLVGNTFTPLVGVFTNNIDPFGNPAPASLTFNANNPGSLSPLLNQVFYIGDGRAGLNNSLGALLSFNAPTNATRLYLGTIDAFNFNGTTGYYNDNRGSFSVSASLAAVSGVPEPATWAMMLVGFGGIGMTIRRSRRNGELTQIA